MHITAHKFDTTRRYGKLSILSNSNALSGTPLSHFSIDERMSKNIQLHAFTKHHGNQSK